MPTVNNILDKIGVNLERVKTVGALILMVAFISLKTQIILYFEMK